MRSAPAFLGFRPARLLVPAMSALAMACDDATAPLERPIPTTEAVISEAPRTRQESAALMGLSLYWADGYVWSGNALSSSSYTLPSDWAFNIAAGRSPGSIPVTKPSGTTGQYLVKFSGLSGWLGSRSTVHVTAENAGGYGIPDDVYCKPVTAILVNDQLDVRCFRASTGAASNGAFRVLATRNYADLAFAYADRPTSSNYAPNAQGSWNPAGTMNVIRSGVGQYEVVFKNYATQLPAGVSGTVQVNAVGTGKAHCKVENWVVSTDVRTSVRCFTQTGLPVDSKFTVLFVTPSEHLAYVTADQPTNPNYSPLSFFSSNPTGNGIVITRTAVGKYRVYWVGVDSEIRGLGNTQVTAWGSDNVQCKANTVNGFTYDFADVLCFAPNGALTDARFTVLLGS